ncbi:MAG TPA: ATP-binding protein [Usitatibacter sp.]|nr:ATP-binding protein [Usitatibacter sp.]
MKIRTHLLLLVAAALLPLLVFTAGLTGYLWWQQRNALELRYLERVRAMTIALDTELDGAIRAMQTLGHSPRLDTDPLERSASRMRRFLDAQPLWETLAVGDPAWKDVAAVSRHREGVMVTAIDPQLLEHVRQTRLAGVSRVVPNPLGTYETQLAVPIVRDGELRWILQVTIEQRAWLKFMSQYPVGPGATLTLIDQDGHVIARTLNNDRWVGKLASADLLEHARGSVEGAYRSTGLEGQRFYTSHSRSVRWGWVVATGIPAGTLDAALRGSSIALAGGALFTLGLAFALAFFVGRRIARPITALGASARALATGEAIPVQTPSDVDEVERVERAFEESGAMLRQRRQELNEALAREQQARRDAEQANRAKDEFLAMLGHELRNPLNAIAGATGVLAHRGVTPEQSARACEIIQRQVSSLRQLVDDLLDVARVTSGKIVLNRRPIDLASVVRGIVSVMGAAGRLGRHRVETDLEPAWISGDETRLEQVVANLLDNAAKYTPEGGIITVRVRIDGNEAVLQVEDTGVGIAPELLPRVFDLFTQGERTLDRAQGGLGLGLALVRRLVELHGGLVEAHSDGAGHGTRLTAHFPAVTPPGEEAPAGPDAQPGKRPLHILVVEDNADGRETLAMMLRLSGHRVSEAESGPAGVEAARALHPDLAIVDIGLPGFDGYEVARRLRAQPDTAAIRLAALTGYGQEDDRQHAMAAGFDWFLVKPADPRALDDVLATI